MNRIILDTGCAAGYLSDITKKSDDWLSAFQNVSSDISDPEIVISTPACIELAKRSDEWYEKVLNPTDEFVDLLRFSNYSITPKIFYTAARYMIKTNIKKKKISYFFDCLIAAYSIVYGFYIITGNQKDFHSIYFDSLNVIEAPRIKTGTEREVIWLLEPNETARSKI